MFDTIHTLITNKGWSPALFNTLIFIVATVLIQALYAWLSHTHDKKAADYPPTPPARPINYIRLIEQHAPGRFTRQQLLAIEHSLQGIVRHPDTNLPIKQFDFGSVVITTHAQQANPTMPYGSHSVINSNGFDIDGVKIELHTDSHHTHLLINGQKVDLTPYAPNHH